MKLSRPAWRNKISSSPSERAFFALSEDDYTTLLMAKAIGALKWTGEDGEFDKLKMVESLGD